MLAIPVMKMKNELTTSPIQQAKLADQRTKPTPVYPSDAERLGYHCDEAGWTVGYVHEINGPGGALAADFQPTNHELIVLAEYWLTTLWDTDFYCYTCNQSGSTEYRLQIYSSLRLEWLVKILGPSVFQEVEQRVDQILGNRFGEDAWREFRQLK
jgi:hypothetical protein